MRPIVLPSVTGTGVSGAVPLDLCQTPFEVTLSVQVTGTIDYTVQYTFNDLWNGETLVWVSHSDLTGKTANANATLVSPVTGVRIIANSGTGTAILKVIQAGAV